MSDAKDFINYQESSKHIRNSLENLANIVHEKFIDDDSELEFALEVQEILEEALVRFLIEKDIEKSPLLAVYEALCTNKSSSYRKHGLRS
jgi:predicted DNA-binding ArsR family transcriptional regulator